MKLLLLPAYFVPELCSDTPLDDARYEAFAKAGMEMILYTSSPTRGVTAEDKEKYAKIKTEKMYGGAMTVTRFWMFDEGKNPLLRAMRYFLCFGAQFVKSLLGPKPDAIFVVSTPPIQGMLAALIKKCRGGKFVYNLQDIFPDTLVGAGMTIKGSMLWKIGRWVEDFTYRNADKIVVISEDFKRNILEKGVPENKIEIIYNWVDEKAITPIKKEDNPLFDEFNLSREKFHVVYAGNLGNAQNIDIILRAGKALYKDESIEFDIFGSGGLEEEIRSKIKTENLSNVKLLPLQPYNRVSYVYSLGDCCVVTCKKGFGGSALPSKTWSILSCGRPVVANFDEGELKHILETNNLGVFTNTDDVEAFVDAIKRFADNLTECQEMGRAGRKYIEDNLTKNVGTSKFVKIIKNVVN